MFRALQTNGLANQDLAPPPPTPPTRTPAIRSQSYKTFYGRKLQIFIISWSVCPWHAFPEAVFLVVRDPPMNEL
jgi:hypothetical protein